MATQRTQVLQLYRTLMRAGRRTWPTISEREYILSESRRLFRRNMTLEDTVEIEKKLFEAQSRWELAQFYGMAAPRYFYNQPGVVEKSANKSAINVRPAYLDSAYEEIGRGAGDDERQKPRPIAAGTVPQRAAAAAAAAAAAERSPRGAIMSGVQPSPRLGTPRPPSSRGPPMPPSTRKPGAPPPVPSLRRPAETRYFRFNGRFSATFYQKWFYFLGNFG